MDAFYPNGEPALRDRHRQYLQNFIVLGQVLPVAGDSYIIEANYDRTLSCTELNDKAATARADKRQAKAEAKKAARVAAYPVEPMSPGIIALTTEAEPTPKAEPTVRKVPKSYRTVSTQQFADILGVGYDSFLHGSSPGLSVKWVRLKQLSLIAQSAVVQISTLANTSTR